MSENKDLLAYTLRMADNALLAGQRMIERVTHEPELEQELANANFALDYIGQARMFYAYAGELEGRGRGEDDFAFMRDGHEFANLLLLELPNGHFGDSLVRQFLFESFYVHQLDALARCADERLSEIAVRALKEVRYHLRHSARWLIRLGDGTDLSHDKVQTSLHDSWRYTGEMFSADRIDLQIQEVIDGPDLAAIHATWREDVGKVIAEATLEMPSDEWMASGGKQGQHTEQLGYLLAEMQYLQRSNAGARW